MPTAEPSDPTTNSNRGVDEELKLNSSSTLLASSHPHLAAKLSRSDSLRSQLSDDRGSLVSSASDNKRVSFNNDVRIKPIPKSKLAGSQQNLSTNNINNPPPISEIERGPFAQVHRKAPPKNPEAIATEAEHILQQLQGIECSVSATPTAEKYGSNSNLLSFARNKLTGGNKANNLESQQQPQQKAMRLESSSSSNQTSAIPSSNQSTPEYNSHSSSSTTTTADNRLYGLHALNNLDIAVNGKEVNSMPSYQEIRRRGGSTSTGQQDSSGGSAEYSPPPKRNHLQHPPKPPRKAPSVSPPSVRRGATSSNKTMASTHYAQPAISGDHHQSSHTMMDQLNQDSRFRKRLMETTGGADDSAIASGDADDINDNSTVTSSYTSRFIRKSPPRQLAPSSRLSPTRTCLTDSEILRSPTEVLYAVSDKHRHSNNEHLANSSSQTLQSDLIQNPPPRAYIKNHHRPRSAYTYSREDLANEDYNMKGGRRSASDNRYMRQQQQQQQQQQYHNSRSLDRFMHDEDNKENAFKTRIQVISPDRQRDLNHRKPYKTMINTATDNIQYRGNSTDNLNYYKRMQHENEHYKVPRNRPVPMDAPYHSRNGYHRMNTDSDHSSTVHHHYNSNGYSNGNSSRAQQQFASTRLVKNVENRRGSSYMSDRDRDRDREGRSIRREAGGVRGRTYSGCSTSPDREGSPDRYSKPRAPPRSYSGHHMQRSPSTSPTRPPRSRSSPTREMQPVRRVPSRREADRSPSTRMTPSRSPIKEITRLNGQKERAHESNGRRSQSSNAKVMGYRNSMPMEDNEDRLARFTEYRGEDIMMPHAQDQQQQMQQQHLQGQQQQSRRSAVSERERGQSLPPGATIDNIRDFYQSSQFKSMYALPPSPNRPAPVLERDRSVTLQRGASRNGQRGVSISEGDVTDEGRLPPPPPIQQPPEKVQRQRSRLSGIVGRPSSAKRQAPSPPVAPSAGKGLVVRRVVSSDGGVRRVVNSSVQQPPPAARRIVVGRRTSIDALDSSYSESEGLNGEADQDKQPLGDFGRRWTANHHSDIDSDYRRELATSGVGLHQEARGRDGGGGGGGSWVQSGRLSRGSSKTNIRTTGDDPDMILRPEDEEVGERSHSSAREEERRKVLEIEEERLRSMQQQRPQLRANVSRSASRASRTAHVTNAGPRGYKPVPPRHLSAGADLDRDSQYSGHSSSQAAGMSQHSMPAKLNRFDQHRVGVGRVRRSTSNANAAAVGAVRREIIHRKTKLPGGSVTSSVNSSESEQGSHAGQSAVSRNTQASNRSVFLHAAAVADIPSAPEMTGTQASATRPPRALSAESRDNLAAASGALNAQTQQQQQQQQQSNLKGSKKISRSISLLAPWKPRPVKDRFEEIHYDNSNVYSNPATRVTVDAGSGKPPRPPTAPPPAPPTMGPPPVRRAATIQRGDKKSASSSDLLRDSDSSNTTPAVILAERRAKAMEQQQQKRSNKVSRSMSMPKDTRLAGWFKKRKRVAA